MPSNVNPETSPLLPDFRREASRSTTPRRAANTPRRVLIWKRRRVFWRSVPFVLLIALLINIWCKPEVPKSINHDFGVGFHLSSPYGTASISFPNGTIVNVVKIEGTRAYRNAMYSLSLQSSKRRTELFLYQPPQYIALDMILLGWRSIRKMSGFAASPEVGELAAMISKLRAAVEATLGRRIDGAASTIPHLLAATIYDLSDAFEHAGLLHAGSMPYWCQHFDGYWPESGAVYVGNGFGICSNYQDVKTCKEEKNSHAYTEYILAISYTREMLTSEWAFQARNFAFSNTEDKFLSDLRFGWDYRHDNPGEDDFYWPKVRDTIIAPLMDRRTLDHNASVQKVLVSGESSGQPKFQQVLKEALSDTLPAAVPVFQYDPLYSAARGTAEMAKQLAYLHNKTDGDCNH